MKPKHGILMMKWCFVALCILTILSVGSISQAATISGNVTDSNGPTQFVNVYLWVVDGSPSPLPGTCTDVNGNYKLSGITAGKYILAAGGKDCHLNTHHAQTFYKVDTSGNFVGTYDFQKADQFNLTGSENLTGKNFYLELGASISGSITGSGGAPLGNVNVGVSPVNIANWGYGACTDSLGNYSVIGLPPGTYRVSAGGMSGCGGLNYAQMFYNNKPDWNSADLITLNSGEALSNVNFSGLVLGAAIAGSVTGAGGAPLANVQVNVNGSNWGWGSCTDSTGSYTISGIPPGTYRVSAGGMSGCGGLDYAQMFYNNKPDWNSADLITLNSGETRPDVNFSGLVLGATISGVVTDGGGSRLANVQVNVNGSNWGWGSCTDSTGSYTIGGIPAGTYRISAGGGTCGGGQLYKQVFYDNKPDWNSADTIILFIGEIRTGINFSGLTLEAAISGMITGDPNIGIRNINVVLHDSLGRLANFQRLGSGGGYYFSGLTPGETYTIKVYDPFLRYQYAERGGLVASPGGLIPADFTLTNYVPTGTNLPIFKSNPMAFVIHRPDGSEILQVSAEVEDPSGCQPASLKSVTAVGPDGTFHYLYHEKYQALVDSGLSYGEFWWTSRDNEFADFNTKVGNYTITVLDIEGNRATATANLGSYSKYKLPIPTLINPASGTRMPLNGLTLIWDTVENALVYQVRITYLGERIWKSGLITETSYTVPTGILSEGRWYDWQIIAFDNATPNLFDYASVSETRNFYTISGGTPPPLEPLSVQIVPWVPGSSLIPHDAYAGRQTTLKAVAKGGTPPFTYTWDFGDGSTSGLLTAVGRYNLQAFYQYSSSSDTFYDAKITVTDSSGAIASATYPVRFWANPSRGVKVNVAIDDALWWLHRSMSRFTSAGIDYGRLNQEYYPTGSTALALQAWVLNGHRPDGDPNNPYVEDAIRAKNFILDHLYPICIGPETVAGNTRNPDSNGNGIGLYVKNGHRMYETGLAIMALATLKDQSLTTTIQDLVDYLSYAQVEPDVGGGRGGWRYDTNYRESDMSVTQFPLIGLESAEYNLGSFVTIPSYVKEELKDNFLYFVQNKESGGFGYSWPQNWVNVAKTGAGLVGLALTGISYNDARATEALSFINDEWLTAREDTNNNAYYNIGDLYAMYAIMKGMKSYEMKGYNTTMIGNHDWYNEYATWEIENQNQYGMWQSPVNTYSPVVDTALGVLILLPQIFSIGPTAVAQASPTSVEVGQLVTFDHSGSFHRDTTRTIILYEWDFNGDGIVDWWTSNRTEIHQYRYNAPGSYAAVLRVTDNEGLKDMDQVVINVSRPVDITPPVILPTVTPAPNPAGWNNTNVTVSWSVSDPESGIASSSGCGTTTLTTETGGTTLTCSATNGAGLSNLASVTVKIDKTAPTVACSASPNSLWPPNHKMVPVTAIVTVRDSLSGSAGFTLTSATSNEPDEGLGDGDFPNDIQGFAIGTPDTSGLLRAERSGRGTGRIYTLIYTGMDVAGNSVTCSATVTVPHDKGK